MTFGSRARRRSSRRPVPDHDVARQQQPDRGFQLECRVCQRRPARAKDHLCGTSTSSLAFNVAWMSISVSTPKPWSTSDSRVAARVSAKERRTVWFVRRHVGTRFRGGLQNVAPAAWTGQPRVPRRGVGGAGLGGLAPDVIHVQLADARVTCSRDAAGSAPGWLRPGCPHGRPSVWDGRDSGRSSQWLLSFGVDLPKMMSGW